MSLHRRARHEHAGLGTSAVTSQSGGSAGNPNIALYNPNDFQSSTTSWDDQWNWGGDDSAQGNNHQPAPQHYPDTYGSQPYHQPKNAAVTYPNNNRAVGYYGQQSYPGYTASNHVPPGFTANNVGVPHGHIPNNTGLPPGHTSAVPPGAVLPGRVPNPQITPEDPWDWGEQEPWNTVELNSQEKNANQQLEKNTENESWNWDVKEQTTEQDFYNNNNFVAKNVENLGQQHAEQNVPETLNKSYQNYSERNAGFYVGQQGSFENTVPISIYDSGQQYQSISSPVTTEPYTQDRDAEVPRPVHRQETPHTNESPIQTDQGYIYTETTAENQAFPEVNTYSNVPEEENNSRIVSTKPQVHGYNIYEEPTTHGNAPMGDHNLFPKMLSPEEQACYENNTAGEQTSHMLVSPSNISTQVTAPSIMPDGRDNCSREVTPESHSSQGSNLEPHQLERALHYPGPVGQDVSESPPIYSSNVDSDPLPELHSYSTEVREPPSGNATPSIPSQDSDLISENVPQYPDNRLVYPGGFQQPVLSLDYQTVGGGTSVGHPVHSLSMEMAPVTSQSDIFPVPFVDTSNVVPDHIPDSFGNVTNVDLTKNEGHDPLNQNANEGNMAFHEKQSPNAGHETIVSGGVNLVQNASSSTEQLSQGARPEDFPDNLQCTRQTRTEYEGNHGVSQGVENNVGVRDTEGNFPIDNKPSQESVQVGDERLEDRQAYLTETTLAEEQGDLVQAMESVSLYREDAPVSETVAQSPEGMETNNHASGGNMDSGSSVDSSSWEKVDYQQEPENREPAATSAALDLQRNPQEHGDRNTKAEGYPYVENRDVPLYGFEDKMYQQTLAGTEVVRPQPVNGPSPCQYQTQQRQESPFRPIVPGTDSGSEPSRPNSVSSAKVSDSLPHEPELVEKGKPDGSSPDPSPKPSVSKQQEVSENEFGAGHPPSNASLKSEGPHPWPSYAYSTPHSMASVAPPPPSNLWPSAPAEAAYSNAHGFPSMRVPPTDTSQIPPQPQSQEAEPPHATKLPPPPPMGANSRPSPHQAEQNQMPRTSDSGQQQSGYSQKSVPEPRVPHHSPSHKPPNASAINLRRFIPGEHESSNSRIVPGGASPPAKSLGGIPGASVAPNYSGDGYPPGGPSRQTPPVRKETLGSEGDNLNRGFQPIRGARSADVGFGSERGNREEYLDQERFHNAGENRRDQFPRPDSREELSESRRDAYNDNHTRGDFGPRRDPYSAVEPRGEYVEGHRSGYSGAVDSRSDNRRNYGESRPREDPQPYTESRENFLETRQDNFTGTELPDSRRETYPGSQSRGEFIDNSRESLPGEEYPENRSRVDGRREPYPGQRTESPRSNNYPEGSERPPALKPVTRPGDYPGGRPGDYPGGRPGDYPGGRSGDHPGGRPGDHPGGRPGDYPGGRPGDYPGGRPGDYPAGRHGDYPGGRPGDYPGGRHGEHSGSRPGDHPGGRPAPDNRVPREDAYSTRSGDSRSDYYDDGRRSRNAEERGQYDDRRREPYEYDRRGGGYRSHPDGFRGGHDSRKYSEEGGRGPYDDRRGYWDEYGRYPRGPPRDEHNRTFDSAYGDEGPHDYRRDHFYRSMDDYIYRNSGSQSRPQSRPSSRGGEMHMEDGGDRRPMPYPQPYPQAFGPHYPPPYDRRDYRHYGGGRNYYGYPWYYQYYQYQYSEEAKRQYKEWYEKHYGRDYEGSIRSTHSSDDLQRERFVSDFHDKGPEQSTILPEKDITYDTTDTPLQRETPIQQRSTPPLFPRHHAVGRICHNGMILRVSGTAKQAAKVDLVDLQEVLGDRPESKELKSFPGPLIRGHTPKKNIIQFCSEKLRNLQLSPSFPDKGSAILIWELLLLLVRQNGNIEGSDLAELLLKDYNAPDSGTSSEATTTATPDEGVVLNERTVVNKSTEVQDFNKLMEYLLFGHKEKALEWAMKCGMWGHAMFLADMMGGNMSSHVRIRFANSFPVTSPLQTLFQLMSGRQPTATTMVSEENWGDWRPHLAMMLSNSSSRPDVDSQSIIAMGDSLASCGLLYSAQFCYVVGKAEFGKFSKKTSKLVLLSASHHQPYEQFATNEAIQCTEVYEYAISLANTGFFLRTFQSYKYLYACRLLDAGFVGEALSYLKQISRALCLLGGMDLSFLKLVFNLAHRLNATQTTGYDDSQWLTDLETLILYQSNASTSEAEKVQEVDHSGAIDEEIVYNEEAGQPEDIPLVPTIGSMTDDPSSIPMVPPPMMVPTQPEDNGQQYLPPEIGVQQQQQPPYDPQAGYAASNVEPLPPTWQPPPVEQPPPVQGQEMPTEYRPQGDFWDTATNRKDSESTVSSIPPYSSQPATVPQEKPPTPKEQPKAENVPPPAANGKSWFGSFMSKLPSLRVKNQAHLPDDTNNTIIWDNVQNRWVNTEEDEDAESSGAAAPPKDSEISPKASQGPPSGGSNMYKLQRVRGVRGNYVDVFGGSNARSEAPAPPPPSLPNAPPQGETPPSAEAVDVGSAPPMSDGPLMFDPSQFSALPPSNSRANTLARRYPPR